MHVTVVKVNIKLLPDDTEWGLLTSDMTFYQQEVIVVEGKNQIKWVSNQQNYSDSGANKFISCHFQQLELFFSKIPKCLVNTKL